MHKHIALSQLVAGDKAEIVRIKARGEVRRRLLDMGLAKGACVKVLRVAPLGDPIEIQIKGFLLSLRLEEADHIWVNKIGEKGDGIPMHGRCRRFRGGCARG